MRLLGRILAGFAREVLLVAIAMVRWPLLLLVRRVAPAALRVPAGAQVVRGARRVRGAGATAAAVVDVEQHEAAGGGWWGDVARSPARTSPATVAGPAVLGDGFELPRPRTEAERRAAARRRELLRRRMRGLAAVLLVAAIVAGWVWLPSLDVFRVRQVQVAGARSVTDLAVRQQVDELLASRTIYEVDRGAIERRLEQLPFVRDARVERHFPGGLSIHLSEYRPLALGMSGNDGWLVARDGRILAPARVDDWRERIPVVVLRADDVEPGDSVGDEPALQLLASAPPGFTATFTTVNVRDHEVVGMLASGIEVRMGRPTDYRIKLAMLQRALEEVDELGGDAEYIDVSVPGLMAIKPR